MPTPTTNPRSPKGETGPDYEKIATVLLHAYGLAVVSQDKPLLAHALRSNGSLSVVAPNGQKFLFSAEEVAQAESDLATMKKLSEKPTPKATQCTQKATRAKKMG